MAATVYDVAERAGVSASTVSRVMNGRAGISGATVEAVEQAMAELAFRPRWKAAPSLTVGVLVYPHQRYLCGPYTSTLMSFITQALFTAGCTVHLIPRENSEGSMTELQRLATAHQLSGLILFGLHPLYGLAERLGQLHLPHVSVGPLPKGSTINTIGTNDYEAGAQAAAYLWTLGHRRLGVITATMQDMGMRRRQQGFCDFVAERGGEPVWTHEQRLMSIGAGEAVVAEYSTLHEPPTALMFANSEVAIAFQRGARRFGLRMPDELSLLAFEDSHELESLEQPITAMRQPVEEIAEHAAGRLLRQLDGEREPFAEVLPCKLLIRESTAAAPTS